MWMVCPRAAGRKSFRNRADGALEQETGAGKMACMECLTNAEDRVNPRKRRETRQNPNSTKLGQPGSPSPEAIGRF